MTVSSDRYNLIDAIRALAIISMVTYHLCYDIFNVYRVDGGFPYYPGVIVWERSICSTFIFVSGISLNFSRHAVRRGIIVNLCGLVISAVMLIFMPSQQIWFGVLNLIGCSMLITYALRKPLGHIPSLVGMLVSLIGGLPAKITGLVLTIVVMAFFIAHTVYYGVFAITDIAGNTYYSDMVKMN